MPSREKARPLKNDIFEQAHNPHFYPPRRGALTQSMKVFRFDSCCWEELGQQPVQDLLLQRWGSDVGVQERAASRHARSGQPRRTPSWKEGVLHGCTKQITGLWATSRNQPLEGVVGVVMGGAPQNRLGAKTWHLCLWLPVASHHSSPIFRPDSGPVGKVIVCIWAVNHLGARKCSARPHRTRPGSQTSRPWAKVFGMPVIPMLPRASWLVYAFGLLE